jgi:hypothetical protein
MKLETTAVGRRTGEVKHFEHLPFAVRYMTCNLGTNRDAG